MRLTTMEKNLSQLIEPELRDVTPGVQVRAFQAGKIVCDIALGQTYAYYDFASLTKIIFTVQAMMVAFDRGLWNLKTHVSEIIPGYRHPTLVKDLLCHFTGFEAWRPFYKSLDLTKTINEKRKELKKALLEIDPKTPVDKSLYSDINFLLLGFIVEELFKENILNVWGEIKDIFYQGTTLEFHVDNQAPHRRALYAPTEECPWRGRLLQGEVHDENTWALGGVSSHAGLFGTIDDLGWYALHLRSQLLGIARYEVKQKTAQLFSKKAVEEGKGEWALGFMMPTPGQASCGHYFDLSSIGHTGFTGTSLWYDPKMDLAVCILSNRLVYGRENNRFKELRPKIHNWLVEGLRKSA
jgi:CubicO group peptidase (beta-lactamase class C family)